MAEQEWFTDEDQNPAPESTMVDVRFNGQTIRMTAEAAKAWEERERAFSQRFSEQGQELGQLRQMARQIQTPPAQQPQQAAPGQDMDLQILQNPYQSIQQMLDEREQRAYQTIRGEMDQRARYEAMRRKFFSQHRDLIGHESKVDYVARERGHLVANLPEDEANEKLADMVRKEFNLGIPGRETPHPGTRTALSSDPVRSARSGPVQARPVQRDAGEWKGPNTTAELQRKILADRERARKAARSGRPPATG